MTNAVRYIALLLLFFCLVVGHYGTVYAGTTTPTANQYYAYLPAVVREADQDVLELTNQLRVQNGCAPLTLSPTLSTAANEHSTDMAANNFIGHTGSDGSSPGKRLDDVGYPFTLAAENVAAGYTTPQDVVHAWFNETAPNDGHRRNILNCQLTEIGIGQAYNPNSTYHFYWTEDFGTR